MYHGAFTGSAPRSNLSQKSHPDRRRELIGGPWSEALTRVTKRPVL